MKQIEVFLHARIDGDRYCVVFVTEDGNKYLPFVMYAEQADMAGEYFAGKLSEQNMNAIDFSKSIISGLGAVMLYGELSFDDSVGMIDSKIVCRQKNEINKIFSTIDCPPAYLIAMDIGVFTDDETLDRFGFDKIEEVSDVIGLDIKHKKRK